MSMSPDAVSSGDPARRPTQNAESPVETAERALSDDQSEPRRKGYWDIMSIFRSGNNSTSRSEIYPTSRSSHPQI